MATTPFCHCGIAPCAIGLPEQESSELWRTRGGPRSPGYRAQNRALCWRWRAATERPAALREALLYRWMLCALIYALTAAASRDGGGTCSDDGANATATQPWGDGMLLVRSALTLHELSQLLAAERAAWADTSEPGLVNHTRRITGSAAVQSVTWLHRHRGFADGAVERVEAAALAAQAAAAGWQLSRAQFGPLHVRCMELG